MLIIRPLSIEGVMPKCRHQGVARASVSTRRHGEMAALVAQASARGTRTHASHVGEAC